MEVLAPELEKPTKMNAQLKNLINKHTLASQKNEPC